ncbi:MAG: type II toxin-antitoxin system HicB family antitoxin [Selenomonadaceae bacterium]|nr:type II toxin-antitoxin system HicB family antitoxin [Selenomonadaceae bacterium]
MQYVYPAIFYEAKEGGYVVEFPDVQGAVTQGETLYEAMEMAEDALAGMLASYEDHKAGVLAHPFTNKVNTPTPISQVIVEPDEYSIGAFVTLVKVDTDAYRKTLSQLQAA